MFVAFLFLAKIDAMLAQTPSNSHFFLNLLNENPANTSIYEERILSINYRNQLPSLASNYVNYGVSYSQPISIKNSSAGFSLMNDVQGNGIINNLSASVLYGYKIKLASRSYLHFGLESSFFQRNYNLSNLILEDENETLQGDYILYIDFSTGIKATIKNFYFGGAILHATPSLFLTQSNDHFTNYKTYLFETGFDIPVRFNSIYQPDLFMSPSLMIKYMGGHQLIQYGTSITRKFLQLGLWLRQDYIFNYDALIFSFAFLQSKFNFVYSYDVKPPWNMHYFKYSGAHEVTFLIKFVYNEKRKLRTIKCPKI